MTELDIERLKAAALAATPIETDLYGDRYFQGAYSKADLTKAQDDFFTASSPATVLVLIAEVERLRAVLGSTEPVAELAVEGEHAHVYWLIDRASFPHGTKLYTAPPAPVSAKIVGHQIQSIDPVEGLSIWTDVYREDYETCAKSPHQYNVRRLVVERSPAPVSAEPVKTSIDVDSAALKATKDVMEIIAKPMQKGRESQRFHRIQCAISDAISVEKGKDQHYDDYAVDCFAAMMKQKLAKKRAQGYDNWYKPELCSVAHLKKLLHKHIVKGDPVDVANLCMMLRHYDASTSASAPPSTNAKDSERYRWMRETFVDDNLEWPDAVAEAKTSKELDIAVDAAIAAKEAGKQ